MGGGGGGRLCACGAEIESTTVVFRKSDAEESVTSGRQSRSVSAALLVVGYCPMYMWLSW